MPANKKREDPFNKTYTVERLLKRRKRRGRIEYLVKWKHYDKSHNSWEPEGNILDTTLIDMYTKQNKYTQRRNSSPKKPPQIEEPIVEKTESDPPPTLIDYWYPPINDQKTKVAITDITSDNVTITIREII